MRKTWSNSMHLRFDILVICRDRGFLGDQTGLASATAGRILVLLPFSDEMPASTVGLADWGRAQAAQHLPASVAPREMPKE